MKVEIDLSRYEIDILNQPECGWISTKKTLSDGTKVEIKVSKIV